MNGRKSPINLSLSSMQANKIERESSYELIRLLAQFFIVFYHLFCFFIYPVTLAPLHKAIWLPLHIGVILFVLISGFFGIRSSIKGFVRLIGMMFVLYVPLDVFNMLYNSGLNGGGDLKSFLSYFFLVSATPFWFMRTYVFLFLLAPLLNHYLKSANLPKRIYLIIVLGFISHWVGTIGLDPSLMDGKNVVTFMFLYVIGNTLARYKKTLSKIPYSYYGLAFVILNVFLVILYSNWGGRIAEASYFRIFFSYCSFGLLLSSLLFFLWIGNMKIRSRFINYTAKASLTIYMIHGSNLIFFNFLSGTVASILATNPSETLLFVEIFALTFCIVTFCILVDILLRPLWRQLDRIGERLTILNRNFWQERIPKQASVEI